MRVIGVIDLRGGVAVHARGGNRVSYQPVRHAASISILGDPLALARFYKGTCGLQDLYVADLDAIGGLPFQHAVIEQLTRLGMRLWVDAGVTSVDAALATRAAGAFQVVVGWETAPECAIVADISRAVGRAHLAFGLDLRDGRPLDRPVDAGVRVSLELLAAQAAVHTSRMIVLDLARIGSGTGPDVETIPRLREHLPWLECYAGGGVRDVDDLRQLEACGAAGALVASALIEGMIAPGDLHPKLTR